MSTLSQEELRAAFDRTPQRPTSRWAGIIEKLKTSPSGHVEVVTLGEERNCIVKYGRQIVTLGRHHGIRISYKGSPDGIVLSKVEDDAPRNPDCETGCEGEDQVCQWLSANGLSAERMSPGSPFDIRCEGKRIEVKTSRFGACYKRWNFRVSPYQRGGQLSDFFIFRLEPINPSDDPLHFVIPSKLITSGFVTISPRNMEKWSPYRDAVWRILELPE